MNEFINTIDVLGDEAVQDMLIEGTLTELNENRLTSMRVYSCQGVPVNTISVPLITTISDNAFALNKAITRVYFPAVNTLSSVFEASSNLTIAHFHALNKIQGRTYCFSGTALEILILSNKHAVASLNGVGIFGGTPIANGTGYVYVRKRLLEEYQNATNWSAIASQIRAIEDYPEIQAIVDADLAEMRGETT